MTKQHLKIGGHRGLGCTDHDKYQNLRDIAALPVENTFESIEQAFLNGADYIETDAVMSADGVLFTIHNVVPKDHFFGVDKPADHLNKMNFTDIQKYKTGRHENGAITPFLDTLNRIAELDPKTLPWAINIEIKGVQGSGQDFESNGYLNNLADTVKKSALPAERILWSSFSLQNILVMSHKFPTSHYGMLFAEKGEPKPIYSNHRDSTDTTLFYYQQFSMAGVSQIQEEWDRHAHAKAHLGYVHPEILTIDKDKIDTLVRKGLGINCWALFEDINEASRLDLYRETARYAAQKDVSFTVITDYLPEMQGLTL